MPLISPEPDKFSPAKSQPENGIVFLPGWPGYRTRTGRTGLDYIDTQIEVAHMTGFFIRQLITGDWIRSHNGVNPLVALVLGSAMVLASPVGSLVCLAAPVLLVIGIFVMLRREPVQDDEVPDERADLAWEKCKERQCFFTSAQKRKIILRRKLPPGSRYKGDSCNEED